MHTHHKDQALTPSKACSNKAAFRHDHFTTTSAGDASWGSYDNGGDTKRISPSIQPAQGLTSNAREDCKRYWLHAFIGLSGNFATEAPSPRPLTWLFKANHRHYNSACSKISESVQKPSRSPRILLLCHNILSIYNWFENPKVGGFRLKALLLTFQAEAGLLHSSQKLRPGQGPRTACPLSLTSEYKIQLLVSVQGPRLVPWLDARL